MAAKFLDLADDMEEHQVTFKLVPSLLNGFTNMASLQWHSVKFRDTNANNIPEQRGVYAFVVAAPRRGLPRHGYVLYVGKAGDGAHNLRKRFRDYCREKVRPKRPRVHRFLKKWDNAMYFFYAEIPDTTKDLKDVEASLNDALLPPMVRNDFSVDIRNAINSFPV